jgi:hypothetical protein
MRDLEKDLALCQAATKEPWKVEKYVFENQFPEGMPVVSEDGRGWRSKSLEIKAKGKRITEVQWMSQHSHYASKTIAEMEANAQFIAEAREALPFWLGEVQTLRARVGELEGALSGLLTAIETHGRFNSLDMTGYPGGNITVSQGLKAKGWWEAVWSAQKALKGE